MAEFTIDGQSGNQAVAAGSAVILSAATAPAAQFEWKICADPPGCGFNLTGENQARAILTPADPGAYVIQLKVTSPSGVSVAQRILWAVTKDRELRLPATGEPLRFDGDPEWAGDLAKLMTDVDAALPSEDQKAALDAADSPTGANRLITHKDLAAHFLSDAQKAALDASHAPSAQNAYATLADLPGPELTPDQKAGLDGAAAPGPLNPFVTGAQLLAITLADAVRAGLDAAHAPAADNSFATMRDLPGPELTPDQEAALDAAHAPSADNPFATQTDLGQVALTLDQKAALDAAHTPAADNPFATVADLPQPEQLLTGDQKAALDAAHAPAADNPFATMTDLPQPEQLLTGDQKAALDASHAPSAQNAYATLADLPGPELTPDQKAGLDGAAAPGPLNPFVTGVQLLAVTLADAVRAGLDAAHAPAADNPFATMRDLPGPELTPDQQAALDAAHTPTADNPFATISDLPQPEQLLTGDQKAGIDAAHQPSADNPFATIYDLGGGGLPTRIAAAGLLDLGGIFPPNTFGGLRVVRSSPDTGTATLIFDGYELNHRNDYVVLALPVHVQAEQKPWDLSTVQLVRFSPEGFVLQMAQPVMRTRILGPCIVQVSQVLSSIPPPPTLEQAIRAYYALIQRERYAEAWPMLSDAFKMLMKLTTFDLYVADWRRSGPATLEKIDPISISADKATVVLNLFYPKALPGHQNFRVRYDFVRDETAGHPSFGYWLFLAGAFTT